MADFVELNPRSLFKELLKDDAHFSAMLRGTWRVLKPGGLLVCRLASSIGMEPQERLAGRRCLLRDGSGRYLVDEAMLLRLTRELGGAKIYLKREDLLHTGAHKINNCLGQALLARRMGKKRIIAETGAGQHGVATATVCALFGLECVVYMGTEDMRRQELNVFRMRLLGAKVVGVESGQRTDARIQP